MQALLVTAPGKLEVRSIEQPSITPYQALVRIECCGVCNSTDWKLINGQFTWAPKPPLILGHESVGRVVEVGSKVRKFKVGDRVTRVTNLAGNGLESAWGGFAEYGVVTDAQALAADGDASLLQDYLALRQNVVSGDVKPEHAALAISLAETASGLIQLPNLRDRVVLVAGTGIAGYAFTLWARLAGARVITLGRRAARLHNAREIGADEAIDTSTPNWTKQALEIAGGPVDGVLEAIGDVALAATLQTLIKPGGFAAAYGAPADGKQFPAGWVSMNVEEHRTYGWVIDLFRRGAIKPEQFLTHTWSFPEIIEALQQVQRGQVLKGVVRIVG